jgi:tetratricopeptide (TPR) repeat protein
MMKRLGIWGIALCFCVSTAFALDSAGGGDADEAIAGYDQAIAANPDDAAAYHSRGLAYYGTGDYDRAIADYTETIRLVPDFAAAYVSRGNAYCDQKDYDRAMADYDQAITLAPDDAVAHNNRGACIGSRGIMTVPLRITTGRFS